MHLFCHKSLGVVRKIGQEIDFLKPVVFFPRSREIMDGKREYWRLFFLHSFLGLFFALHPVRIGSELFRPEFKGFIC